MAKKKSGGVSNRPASSGGGESNTGLVVSLVIAILLALTLGVFTYLGYSGQTDLQAKAKSSDASAAKAAKDRDDEKVRRLVLAVATGNDAPGELQQLTALRN